MTIEVANLSVTYNEEVVALNDMNLNISKEDWLTILGPSGSGKTTLLNIIAGLLRDFSGSITVEENDLAALSEEEIQTYRREHIGYIFQDYRLFQQYTVLENIIMPFIPYQQKNELIEKALKVVDDIGLTHRKDALPGELSGGEKQRTAIARAILNEPSIILCDEPTGNLDEKNRDNILKLLKKENDKGTTIILVTHDSQIVEWGNRTVQLRDGKLLKEVSS